MLYNIIKAHEDYVKEIVDEKQKEKAASGCPLALLSKSNVKDGASNEEECVLGNYDGQLMAYYSNNNAKKLYMMPMKGN